MMQGLLLHNAQVSGAGSTQSKGQTLASFDGWHLGSNAQLQPNTFASCNKQPSIQNKSTKLAAAAT
jgi:hypothetical protein